MICLYIFLLTLIHSIQPMLSHALDTLPISGNEMNFPKEVPIELEFARTPTELSWGLMDRKTLPYEKGMLFIYEKPKIGSIWMYNVHFDLSVAFIDQDHIIRELHDAESFLDIIPKNFQCKHPWELEALSSHFYFVKFFIDRKITSKQNIQYVLEVNKGWFDTHHIKVGDRIEWDFSASRGRIIKNLR